MPADDIPPADDAPPADFRPPGSGGPSPRLIRDPDRLAAAVAAIDSVNAEDPELVLDAGAARPKALVHAEHMTHWVLTLDPDADDAQQLAARGHHLRRWAIPRQDYPAGRAGYRRWRRDLSALHAREVSAILAGAGYDAPFVDRVAAIVRKEGLGRDAAVQTHEDALCIVFVELQLDGLVERLGEDKMVDVAAKTLRKMSPGGVTCATEVPMSDRARAVLIAAAERVGG